MVGNQVQRKKPRVLCLLGFRTSGEILKKMIGKWPESVLRNFDLDFLDGSYPARGKSDVESLYDPPYYQWYQVNKGTAFTKVPKIKFVIIISGFALQELKSVPPKLLSNLYSVPIDCPSIHIIGEKDFLKEQNYKLMKLFVNPFLIQHSVGHTVPRLDEKDLEKINKLMEKIQEMFMFPQELQSGLGLKSAL
ncbi:uncharacterized protein LOC120132399 [Hibiscus syriacus]|uniref:uncharacterized protein LOC120132399 n=1 Tax=Hibiscus syriacus TaxID=106335 RepID=UPI001922965F|nr:uncharacterized protein LOC120132399 [Hibiscus syriacus]